MDDYIVDLGMIPGCENVIAVEQYAELQSNRSEVTETSLFNKLQSGLACKDVDKIQFILDEILLMPAGGNMECDFIKLLVPYLHSTQGAKIKQIMRKFGIELRRELRITPPFWIKLNMDHKGTQLFKLHWHSKVKNIRNRVSLSFSTKKKFVLEFQNYELDNDEYLIDCGLSPGQENEVKVIMKEESVSKQFNYGDNIPEESESKGSRSTNKRINGDLLKLESRYTKLKLNRKDANLLSDVDVNENNYFESNLMDGNILENKNSINGFSDQEINNVINDDNESKNGNEKYLKNDILNFDSLSDKSDCLVWKRTCDYEINVVSNELKTFDDFQSLGVINELRILKVFPTTIIQDNRFDRVIEVCDIKWEIKGCVNIKEEDFLIVANDVKSEQNVICICNSRVTNDKLLKRDYH